MRLVTSAAVALGADLPRVDRRSRFDAAVGSHAPLRVCLVIDDVETLHHSGIHLLGELLDALPGNLRLVLVGRELPPVGLARLRAAGELLKVTDGDLRFDAAEIADLADRLGTTAPDEHLGGWPAVIRLSLAAPGRAADDYLWEEVINRLAPDHRRALQALCALGSATVAEVEQVSGLTLDVDDFCAHVPLVTRDGTRPRGPRPVAPVPRRSRWRGCPASVDPCRAGWGGGRGSWRRRGERAAGDTAR